MARLIKMGPEGHTTIELDTEEAVAEAEEIVRIARERGQHILEKRGKGYEQVDVFNPQAEETYILVPMAGG